MTQAAREAAARPARLLLLGSALGLCARLFAPAPRKTQLRRVLSGLRETLSQLYGDGAGQAFGDLPSEDALQAEHRRLFVRPLVSPYQTSYGSASGGMGGKTQQLADISGFYRAFGFQVGGERPDHLGAELEFVALTCVKEAYARLSANPEGAEVCAQSRRTFLREHLGAWVPAFQQELLEHAAAPVFAAAAAVLTTLNAEITVAEAHAPSPVS